MRKIKFRVKDRNNQWHYGYPLIYNDESFSFVDYEKLNDDRTPLELCTLDYVEDNTLGEFTGLHDKNGREIYEGDILTNNCCNRHCDFHIQGYVAFDELRGYVLKTTDGDSGNPNWRFGADRNLEVLGNVYDNPQLLKGEEL